MAIVESSLLKGISGRLGEYVFYTVGDKTYVRRVPEKVSNPRTPAQTLQRWRQVCVQTLYRSVKGTLLQAAAGEAAAHLKVRSGYHLFLSRNINAFGEGDNVDYGRLCFGGVRLQLPPHMVCEAAGAGRVRLAWQAEVAMTTAAPDDRLLVAAVLPEEPYRLVMLEGVEAVRSGRQAEVRLPDVQGEVHLYCLFVSAAGEAFSPDVHFCVNL